MITPKTMGNYTEDEIAEMMATIKLRGLMKDTVMMCLALLIEKGHLEAGQIAEWELFYWKGLAAERGSIAAATVNREGKHLIVIDDTIEEKYLLEALVHETVHLAQFFRRDAYPGSEPNIMNWRGKVYTILPADSPEYKQQPWEEEAFRLTPQLMKLIQPNWNL